MAKVAAEAGSTANRYQILAKLAVGGMAEIFLVRGASVAGVERYCVLKRILRERASDAQFVQMFLDEARLAAQLQHPNIASVYDIGVLGDSYFFTMEYVHGETVRSLLERAQELNRQVPLACVLTIIAGAASGLHHAHERNSNDGRPLGIVHRDVSPSNLMVSFEGNVKLVDFGVAKADDRAVETQSGTVKGKISYLSPEQCRGERVDRRSDLFSLGIVMWELLTGARLYRRDSDFANMTAIVNEPPPPPSTRRHEVPRTVDDIVLRLLAKSVADRFQTADEVVEAIENASMRAGTILSTSAVSRLVRDLFGVRAEPWLELEGETGTHQAVDLASRPLPEEFGDAPYDEAAPDLELSSASTILNPDDLSAISEVGPLAPPPVPAAPPARSSGAAIPFAAPSRPSSPSVTTAPSRPSRAATPSTPPVAAPAVAPAPTSRPPRAASYTTPPALAAPTAAPPAPAPASRPPRPASSTTPPAAVPAAVPATPSAPIAMPAARPSQAIPLASPGPGSAPASSPVRPSAPGTLPAPTASSSSGEWNSTLRDLAPPGPWGAAPRTAGPGSVNTTLRDLAPSGPVNATLLDAGPPGSVNVTLLDAGPPGSVNVTLLDAGPPGTPSLPNATLLGVSGPPLSASGARPSVFPISTWVPPQVSSPVSAGSPTAGSPVIAELPPSHSEPSPVTGSGPNPALYPPAYASINLPRAPVRTAEPPVRVAWPLVIVIVIAAAAIGVLAVWLWMRNGKERATEISSTPMQRLVAGAGSSGADTTSPSAPPGTAAVAGSLAAGGAPEDATDQATMPTPAPQASGATPEQPADAPSSPSEPSSALADAPAPSAVPANRRPPSAAAPQSAPSVPTPAIPAPKPSTAPGTSAPSFQSLSTIYNNNDYPTVARVCSASTLRADFARVCLLTECRQHNKEQAKRWLSMSDRAVRNQLVAYCKEIGNIDIGPAADCPKNTPGCP